MRALLTFLALALATPAWAATVTASDPIETALTIYPDNLALVTERRTVQLPAGTSTVQFEGVSDLIIPQSLILRSFTGASLERNFDYDLLGRVSLFENAIGETIGLTRIDAASGDVVTDTAEIVSANAQNGIVVQTDEGYEGLYCSGLKVQESFEGLPPGLRARPAMTIELNAEVAGEQEVTISYLTSGLGWAADYRLDLASADTADILGWLSLNNRTAKNYEEVALSIIAGQVQRRPETRGIETRPQYLNTMCWPVGSTKTGKSNIPPPPPPPPAPMAFDGVMMESLSMEDEIIVTASRVSAPRDKAVQEDFGDYKLYRIPMPVTVAPYQTKQVAFLSESAVETERLHTLDLNFIGDGIRALAIRYDIDNDKDGPLAKPLPAGQVRVFDTSPTVGAVFLGEDRIEDIPIGLPAKVTSGRSTTVFASIEPINTGRSRLTLTNAGTTPAIVELTSNNAKLRLTAARRTDDPAPTWRITVPPNDRIELTMRL